MAPALWLRSVPSRSGGSPTGLEEATCGPNQHSRCLPGSRWASHLAPHSAPQATRDQARATFLPQPRRASRASNATTVRLQAIPGKSTATLSSTAHRSVRAPVFRAAIMLVNSLVSTTRTRPRCRSTTSAASGVPIGRSSQAKRAAATSGRASPSPRASPIESRSARKCRCARHPRSCGRRPVEERPC